MKAAGVTPDPLERLGRRFALNLGHTVGHALEAASGYRLTHGERVFVASEARPVLTSAQSYVSGLLCDPAESGPKICRAKRPADLPAAPHAVFALGGRSTHAEIDGARGAT
ncbi:MAG TPA: 3-dehydroquinate synthase, partial [Thermoanaerobaculia bacterium]|nr:3-dehydroquinate synthase [Thermoanaerobaculia bacterium]